MADIVIPSPLSGHRAKCKLLVLGSISSHIEILLDQFRSLNIEHVSPFSLSRQEISRRAVLAVHEVHLLARMRLWFFSRKPDAGFVLSDFPATLLQAKVFDEWMESRDEAINAVVLGESPRGDLVDYYCALGLVTKVCVPSSL
jgi:adenylate kinase